MRLAVFSSSQMDSAAPSAAATLSTRVARTALLVVIAAAFVASFLATDADTTARAVAQSGDDLTRLLRAMAAIKAVMAAVAVAAVLWRLGAAIKLPWLAAYALACGAMAAGPVLIWGMAHVSAGAVLLHGGLLASIVLLWRDPVVGARLAALVASRRATLAGRR